MAESTDAAIDAALKRGRIAHRREPRAAAVRYDGTSGRVIVDLENGCTFAFPPRLAQGLEAASDDQLSTVEILGKGYGLRWEKLDVDLSLPGLMAGIFGTKVARLFLGEGGSSPVVTTAVIRAADHLNVSGQTLATILGMSEADVARMRGGEFELEPCTKPFELAVLFVRLFRSLDSITGGDSEVSLSWLASPNAMFDGRPIEKLQTVSGLVDVIAYLDARRTLA